MVSTPWLSSAIFFFTVFVSRDMYIYVNCLCKNIHQIIILTQISASTKQEMPNNFWWPSLRTTGPHFMEKIDSIQTQKSLKNAHIFMNSVNFIFYMGLIYFNIPRITWNSSFIVFHFPEIIIFQDIHFIQNPIPRRSFSKFLRWLSLRFSTKLGAI